MRYLIFVFLSLNALGSESFIYKDRINNEKLKVFKDQETTISDTPDCRNKKCFAHLAVDKKIPYPKKLKVRGGMNPTSVLCRELGALPDIGMMSNGDDISLCVFKDKSFAFAWDLYKIFEKAKK
jgi:hypothetical protein